MVLVHSQHLNFIVLQELGWSLKMCLTWNKIFHKSEEQADQI